MKKSKLYQSITKSKIGRLSIWVFMILIFIAFLSPFIANDVPLLCKSKDGLTSPVLQKIIDRNYIHNNNCSWHMFPIIPYDEKTIDIDNANFVSPFESQNVLTLGKRHWLGTDNLGRDTLAGLIHGSSLALKIGFFAALFSLIIGLVTGTLAAFYGNRKIRINLIQLFFIGLFFFLLIYQIRFGFFFGYEYDLIREIIFLSLYSLLIFASIYFSKNISIKKFYFPLDNIVLSILEMFKSIPNIFFVLVLISIVVAPGVFSLVLIIAFVSWPRIARFTRAEVLKIKEQDYIKSADVVGLKTSSILFKHIILNAAGPALVSFAFSFASAILLEATLSFLGIGLAVEQVTWGSMLSEVRTNYKAWWLALFPGVLIFFVVSALNYLGELALTSLRD